jgi:predicted O-methyltransferase YrrM
MGTPFMTRVRLKIQKVARDLDPAEREWRDAWPLIDSIGGFFLEDQAKWLFKAARALPDGSNLVEVGSFKGRSTCCLGFGCRGTRKRVFAIDPFDGGPDLPRCDSFQEFSQNTERCGLSEHIQPLIGLSGELAKTWRIPIHLLFIDGSHKYEDVLADFEGFFPRVVPGGIVAFHDVNEDWPGVYRAWHEVIGRQLEDIGDCNTMAYGRKRVAMGPRTNGSR